MKHVSYYIYHPRGSSKLPAAKSDVEAYAEFNSHWTLKFDIAAGKVVRRLIRETREEITP